MAPPPEYDKEPKAPDKSVTNISCEETKALHNLVTDQQNNSDNKSTSTAASADVENNKEVETLDDGQLRALLDEAITYKNPKDREGKSNLFKELLEAVEQDDQSSETAPRGLGGRAGVGRAGGSLSGARGSRSRRQLPQSNSLQDLVAALAAEPTPRRHHRAPPAPAPAPVSTRAIHGGSLPSGVDTSFLYGEEPARGAGYLATVRCVNPPPLGERRVSATDANYVADVDSLNRRSKPAFPMYTARATLEIGSGAVCSGRAVTSTTASNQVRTSRSHHRRARTFRPPHTRYYPSLFAAHPTAGPPERLYAYRQKLYIPNKYPRLNYPTVMEKASNSGNTKAQNRSANNSNHSAAKKVNNETPSFVLASTVIQEENHPIIEENIDPKQSKLLRALFAKVSCDEASDDKGGGSTNKVHNESVEIISRGPQRQKTETPIEYSQLMSSQAEWCITEEQNKVKAEIDKNKCQQLLTAIIVDAQREDVNLSKESCPSQSSTTQHENVTKFTFEKLKDSENDHATIINGKNKNKTKKKKNKNLKNSNMLNTEIENKECDTLPKEPAKVQNECELEDFDLWTKSINTWYEDVNNSMCDYSTKRTVYNQPFLRSKIRKQYNPDLSSNYRHEYDQTFDKNYNAASGSQNQKVFYLNTPLNTCTENIGHYNSDAAMQGWPRKKIKERSTVNKNNQDIHWVVTSDYDNFDTQYYNYNFGNVNKSRNQYNRLPGKSIHVPKIDEINPRNIRKMTIGQPIPDLTDFSNINADGEVIDKSDHNDKIQMFATFESENNIKLVDNKLDVAANVEYVNLDIDDGDIADMTVNLSIRSSTPISEKSICDTSFNVSKPDKLELAVTTDTDELLGENKIQLTLKESNQKTEDLLEESEKGKSSGANKTDNSVDVSNNLPDKFTDKKLTCQNEILFISEENNLKTENLLDESEIKIQTDKKIDVSNDLLNYELELTATTDKYELPGQNEIQFTSEENIIKAEDLLEESENYKGTVEIQTDNSVEVSDDLLNNKCLYSSSKEENQCCAGRGVVDSCAEKEENIPNFNNISLLNKSDAEFDEYNAIELKDITTNNFESNRLNEENKHIRNVCDRVDIDLSSYFVDRQKPREYESFDDCVELTDMSSSSHKLKTISTQEKNPVNIDSQTNSSFSKYLAVQQKLIQALGYSNVVDSSQVSLLNSSLDSSEKVHNCNLEYSVCINDNIEQLSNQESQGSMTNELSNTNVSIMPKIFGSYEQATTSTVVENIKEQQVKDQYVLVLTKQPNRLFSLTLARKDNVEERDINSICEGKIDEIFNEKPQLTVEKKTKSKSKKKNDLALQHTKIETSNKRVLKAVMFDRDIGNKMMTSHSPVVKQVDSAIPFSCITTPEVVASCNTTSTTQSSVAVDPKPLQLASSYRAVASLTGEEPPPHAAPPPPPAAPPPPDPAPAPAAPAPGAAPEPDQVHQQESTRLLADVVRPTSHHPRSVISSTFNGLPLTRPSYGATGNTQDEYKKSIDENGNSVQGFSSPLSGSSQHKKPRRKKSSKNETVIKSHQIDGYQGNKDLNEVLRFIESAADNTRQHKLPRAKHRDDADDKGGKKRSGARKDKESKIKRATSMEELSRTTLEDLTDKPAPARTPRHSDQGKAERRSWGDDAREGSARFYRDEPPPAPAPPPPAPDPPPDTGFQTVTKRRKPRRRADEGQEAGECAGGDPPRPARAPSPRARRVSAPPSDRSNDSNDDMDSVHSLPADAASGRAGGGGGGGGAASGATSVPAAVSYADIARTRHNIPDLIESCNYYAGAGDKERCVVSSETVVVSTCPSGGCPPSAGVGAAPGAGGVAGAGVGSPGDVDGYPALEPRGRRGAGAGGGAAPKMTHVQLPARRDKKLERVDSRTINGTLVSMPRAECRGGAEGAGGSAPGGGGGGGGGAGGEWPAPDVVADRRPAVILLDSSDARDMDGVTFGFDINHTLLDGGARRGRCDLLRDALEEGGGAGDPPPPAARACSPPPGAGGAAGAGGVCVRAGLRFVPPPPAAPHAQASLYQLVDYVATAWDDIVRCGTGKVRYYSE